MGQSRSLFLSVLLQEKSKWISLGRELVLLTQKEGERYNIFIIHEYP